MKRIIFLAIFAFISNLSAMQTMENKVPKSVTSTFSKMFPKATDLEWEKENVQEWEAEFKLNSKKYSAKFSTDGVWQETEHEIKISKLPLHILDKVKAEYSNFEIEKVELSERPKLMVYEIHIEVDDSDIEIQIDEKGNILKRVVKKEDDEEKIDNVDEGNDDDE